jgi:hypothetical protein
MCTKQAPIHNIMHEFNPGHISSLGSLTLCEPEAGDFVELVLLYNKQKFYTYKFSNPHKLI